MTRRAVLGGAAGIAAAATVGLVLGLRDRVPAPVPVPPPALRWQLPPPGRNVVVRVAPGPGIALVRTDTPTVRAVDLGTGAVRWSHPVDPAFLGNVASTADTVYVAVSGALTALDARTGLRRWQTPTCLPIAAVGPVVVGWRSGPDVPYRYALAGLDVRNGAILWQTPVVEAPAHESAAAGDGLLHVAVDQDVLTVDAATGRIVWRHTFPVAPVNLQRAGGVLAVTALSRDRVTALDARTGEPRWEQPGNPDGSTPPSVGAACDVLVLQVSGTVSAWDPDSGDELWSAPPRTDGVSQGGGLPIAGPGTVVALDTRTELNGPSRPTATAYDPSTGTELWSVPLPSELPTVGGYATLGGPFVAEGTLVYADGGGVVRGFGPVGR